MIYYLIKLTLRVRYRTPHFETRNLRAASLQREDSSASLPGTDAEPKEEKLSGKPFHFYALGVYFGYARFFAPLLFEAPAAHPAPSSTGTPLTRHALLRLPLPQLNAPELN